MKNSWANRVGNFQWISHHDFFPEICSIPRTMAQCMDPKWQLRAPCSCLQVPFLNTLRRLIIFDKKCIGCIAIILGTFSPPWNLVNNSFSKQQRSFLLGCTVIMYGSRCNNTHMTYRVDRFVLYSLVDISWWVYVPPGTAVMIHVCFTAGVGIYLKYCIHDCGCRPMK